MSAFLTSLWTPCTVLTDTRHTHTHRGYALPHFYCFSSWCFIFLLFLFNTQLITGYHVFSLSFIMETRERQPCVCVCVKVDSVQECYFRAWGILCLRCVHTLPGAAFHRDPVLFHASRVPIPFWTTCIFTRSPEIRRVCRLIHDVFALLFISSRSAQTKLCIERRGFARRRQLKWRWTPHSNYKTIFQTSFFLLLFHYGHLLNLNMRLILSLSCIMKTQGLMYFHYLL